MLVANVIVAITRQLVGRLAVAQHVRAQENHEVGLVAIPGLVLEQVADDGDVAQQRNFALVVLAVVRNQPANHDDLAIVDQHGILDRTLVGDQVDRLHGARGRHHAGHFQKRLELHRSAFCHLWRDLKGQANVFTLDGLERVGRCVRRLREAAGDKRHILADDDFSLFVVEREDIRRRQDVALLVRLERACKRAEVQHFSHAGEFDRAADDADIETGVDRADIAGRTDDVGAGAAEVSAADHLRATAVDAGKVLPLNTELGSNRGADFYDERFDVHLRAPCIELFDHGSERVVNMIRRDDHQ